MSDSGLPSAPAIMESIDLEIQADKAKARALAEELRDLNKKTYEKELVKKSKEKINQKQI